MKRLLVVGAILCSIMFGSYSPSANNKSTAIILPDNTHSYNRDTVFSVKSLHDTAGILRLCFSPIKTINKKIACWKPTVNDFFNLTVSDDGLCHTRTDTIIDLDPGNYLVLFRTDGYDANNKVSDCHVCSPVYGLAKFKFENNLYTLLNFNEGLISAGSFGNGYDKLSVEKFGRDYPLLKFSHSYPGQGTMTETSTYFELDNFKQVFEYDNYRLEGDSAELDPNYSETQRYLMHIPNKDSQYRDDIELKVISKHFDKSKKKIESKQTIEYYREDDFGNFKRALQ